VETVLCPRSGTINTSPGCRIAGLAANEDLILVYVADVLLRRDAHTSRWMWVMGCAMQLWWSVIALFWVAVRLESDSMEEIPYCD